MLIHIIRHTTPNIDAGICYGDSDITLTDSFEQERDVILSKLQSNYDAVFTSPLHRCAKLSESINTTHYCVDDRLKEYNFGDWELRPWSDLNDDVARLWMDNFVEQAAPNGDSLIVMKKRVDDFWQELVYKDLNKVAIVTHAGVLRLIHAAILETPLKHLFRLQLNYGAILEVHSNLDTGLETIKHL